MRFQSCTYDQDVVLDDPELFKLGCTFAGWSQFPLGRAEYAAGSTVRNLTQINGGFVTLYAVWQTAIDVPIVPNPPDVELMTLSLEPEESFPTETETVSYTYDAAGNRSEMVVAGEENYTTVYTYDSNNRLLTEAKTENGETVTTTYTYDVNGNNTRKETPAHGEEEANTTANTYNGFNQLIQVGINGLVATYAYNAQGIRTTKIVNDTQTNFLLDGGNVVAEIQNETVSANYLRGVNLISKEAAATEYYLFNAHGDIVNLTSTTGAVTKTYDYDAFGNEKNPEETDTNPFRYCGEYYDKEMGTYYLRARYYDPAIGRFTTEDTYIGSYTDPLTLNLYTYCTNNPIVYTDPNGHMRVSTLNLISNAYNQGKMTKETVSTAVFYANLSINYTVFHEIAQIHLAKYLYDYGYYTQLEYSIPKVGEIDLIANNTAYEIKPYKKSGGHQLKNYIQSSSFVIGTAIYAIADIPILDNIKMGVVSSNVEAGVAHYFFYRIKEDGKTEAVASSVVLDRVREMMQNEALDVAQGVGFFITMAATGSTLLFSPGSQVSGNIVYVNFDSGGYVDGVIEDTFFAAA